MKKIMAWLIIATVMLGLAITSALAEEPVTITITTSLYVEDAHQKALDGLIEAYKKIKPNVTIEIYGAAYDHYWDNITTEIIAGTEPDIIQMYQENIGRYDSMRLEGTFLDLDPYIKGTEYEKLTAQEYCKYNGVYKAISSYATSTSALFYRKSMLEKAGVDPEKIITMDDWREALKKLKVDNQYGVGFIVAAHTFTANEWARILARPVSGGVYFTGNEGLDTGYTADNINVNNPANVWAAQYWTELLQRDKTARVVDSKKTSRELFYNGELAFNHDGSWFVGMINARDPELLKDVGIIPIPMVNYNGNVYKANPTLYAVVSCVSAKSKHPQEAVDFLKWMASDEAQKIIEVSGMIPSNPDYVEKSGYAQRNPLNDQIYQYQKSTYADVLVSDPPIPQQGELQQVLVDACQEIFANGADAQQTLDAAAEQMKAIMK